MLLTHICGIQPQSVTAQVPMKRPWDMWANDLHISKYDDINTAIAYRIGCMETTVNGNSYFVQANSFIDTWDDIILHHCSYIYIYIYIVWPPCPLCMFSCPFNHWYATATVPHWIHTFEYIFPTCDPYFWLLLVSCVTMVTTNLIGMFMCMFIPFEQRIHAFFD